MKSTRTGVVPRIRTWCDRPTPAGGPWHSTESRTEPGLRANSRDVVVGVIYPLRRPTTNEGSLMFTTRHEQIDGMRFAYPSAVVRPTSASNLGGTQLRKQDWAANNGVRGGSM